MTKASIDLQDLRRRLYVKAKAETSWRFWGLYVHVCKLETLRAAYTLAKENDGAPGVDGVTFAAIETHIRAFREFTAVLDALAIAETEAWHAPRGQRRAARKRLALARADERRLGDLESGAFESLAATVPHTLPGAAAMLGYVRAWLADGHSMDDEEETITLLASIESAICKAAGLPGASLS